jgi:putative ubiquitin-RnfH superfamily antitoxin RatB of RatAB toxin-antitoxin module
MSLYCIHTLYATHTVENSVKALGITYIKAQSTLENAVVGVYVYLAHIDAEVVGHDIGQID